MLSAWLPLNGELGDELPGVVGCWQLLAGAPEVSLGCSVQEVRWVWYSD